MNINEGRFRYAGGTSLKPHGPGQDLKIDKKWICGQKGGLGERLQKRFSSILGAVAVLDRFLTQNTSFFHDFWYVFRVERIRMKTNFRAFPRLSECPDSKCFYIL